MSVLKADTIQSTGGGAATLTKQSAAKSWLHYDQKDTIVVRASFNVSSVADEGSGDFTINFTSAMSDGLYVPQMCSNATISNLGFNRIHTVGNTVAGSVRMVHYENQNGVDTDLNAVSIHGDLA